MTTPRVPSGRSLARPRAPVGRASADLPWLTWWAEKTYTWLDLAGATLQDDSLRLGAADPARSA
ncbi:hypothetical protein ACWDG9_38215, partial [Streptomyces sp. NPDC001073]